MNAFAKALQALPVGPYVLAVSGGRDSMALLHAVCAHRPEALSAVATFDHGTGVAAAAAAELVVSECLARGVPVVAGRAPDGQRGRRSESVWRDARWAFLRTVAAERRAIIATAHTADDQAETVAIRILRGASARGLAGMAAETSTVARPLLEVRRAEVAAYAERHGVRFMDDPTNADRAYLRNRLRADLLAAVEAARPGFVDELLAIGERAARWREELAAIVDACGVTLIAGGAVVQAESLATMDVDGLACVWPEIAARAGVVMDRRGIERLAAWSRRARAGQRMPLAGGATVERTGRTFVVRSR